jgi:hypothetical protein
VRRRILRQTPCQRCSSPRHLACVDGQIFSYFGRR